MNKFLLMLLLFLPVGASARGAEAKPVAPVLRPPERAHWVMTITPAPRREETPLPAAAGPRARRVETMRSGGIECIRITPLEGAPFEQWRVGGLWLGRSAITGKARAYRFPPGEEPYPYTAPGFYGIGKVRPEDDQGETTLSGKRYRYFRFSGGDGSDPERRAYEAWFDPENGLPVLYREGALLFRFEFRPPASLSLPPELEAARRRHLHNLRRVGTQPLSCRGLVPLHSTAT